jgi:hypothetical protein
VSIGAKIRYNSEENSSEILGLKCRKAMMEVYEIVKSTYLCVTLKEIGYVLVSSCLSFRG